jgi:ATP-binding cassette subfamily C (CFTR/MRP) protein 1
MTIHADERNASYLSKLTFGWLYPLLKLGASRPLEASDLGEISPEDQSSVVADNVAHLLQREPHLLHVIIKFQLRQMLLAGFFMAAGALLGFVGPLALEGIVKYVDLHSAGSRDELWGVVGFEMERGIWWVIALFSASLIQNLCLHQHHHLSMRAALDIQAALSALVYRKSLRISSQERNKFGTGFINNLCQQDANTVSMVCWYANYAWSAPMQLIICMYLLIQQLGTSAFVALGVLLALVPAQSKVGSILSQYVKSTLKFSDARIKLINEMFSGIRIVKLMAWETAFATKVYAQRSAELDAKQRTACVGALNNTLLAAVPLLVSVLTFLTVGYVRPAPLSASEAFTALALFNILRLPLFIVPTLVSAVASARPSLARLSAYLSASDMADYRTTARMPGDPALAMELQAATLSWGAAATDSKHVMSIQVAPEMGVGGASVASPRSAQLLEATLAVPRGQLTLVVGPVGSGKSTLLAAFLGELELLSGHVCVYVPSNKPNSPNNPINPTNLKNTPYLTFDRAQHESVVERKSSEDSSAGTEIIADPITEIAAGASSVAFAAQQPFILNTSVKNNILFGLPVDESRYARVLAACALLPDLAALPAGDATEIGERGVNLSGGQKARVALARCLYSRCSTVLLDDPFAAVDAHVARHLVEHVLCGPEMAGRTVLLVTHQVSLVAPLAHTVAVLEAGRVVQVGRPAQLLERPGPFAALLRCSDLPDLKENTYTRAVLEAEATESSAYAPPASAVSAPPAAAGREGLVLEEDRLRGEVPPAVYVRYFSLLGCAPLAFLAVALLALNVGGVGSDWFLALWADDALGRPLQFYIGVYGAINLATVCVTLVFQLAWAMGGFGRCNFRSVNNLISLGFAQRNGCTAPCSPTCCVRPQRFLTQPL